MQVSRGRRRDDRVRPRSRPTRLWSGGDTPAVVAAWQEWAPAGPDELAASLFVEAAGERGRPPVVYVFGTMVDTRSRTTELLDDVVARAGADPVSASLEHLPYRETKRYLAEHGPGDDRPGAHPYASPSTSAGRFRRRPSPP